MHNFKFKQVLVIFLYIFFFYKGNAQNITNEVELLKLCNNYSIDTSSYQDSLIELIASELDHFVFNVDTLKASYLRDNYAFLKTITDTNMVRTHGSNGTNKLIITIDNYLHSQNYLISDSVSLLNQLASEDASNLFCYVVNKCSDSIILYFIDEPDTISKFSVIGTHFFNCKEYFNSNVLISLLNKHRQNNNPVYTRTIIEINQMEFPFKDSIFGFEKEWLQNNYDSNSQLDILALNILNNNVPRNIERIQIEEKIKHINDSLNLIRVNEAIVRDSTNWAAWYQQLNSQERTMYIARSDTTLSYDATRAIESGDDGILFNLWSTDSLFLYLDMIQNLDGLYNLNGRSAYGLNTNVRVIHLRKIIQVIGDRINNEEMQPNHNQEKTLKKYVDYYFMHAQVLNDSLQSESKFQLLRLWKYILPDIILLTESDSTQTKQLVAYMLDYLFNEDLVNYFVNTIQTDGELEPKIKYFKLLSILYYNKEINEGDIPQ